MFHKKRVWCVSKIASAEELAEKRNRSPHSYQLGPRSSLSMGLQRCVQELQHRTALQPQTLDRREHALHESTALRTVAAERTPSP